MSIMARLEGWLWDHSQLWRRPARVVRDGLRALRNGERPTVGLSVAPSRDAPPLPHPAIVAVADDEASNAQVMQQFLARQTETSVVISTLSVGPAAPVPKGVAPRESHLFLGVGHTEELEGLPATHLEALLLVAAAEDPAVVRGGWTRAGQHTVVDPVANPATDVVTRLLLRLPQPGDPLRQPVATRDVPHGTDRPLGYETADPSETPEIYGPNPATRLFAIDHRLAALPEVEGPPTALFLLPYVAVGGAERQLLDVLDEWGGTYRCLIVTLEPHGDARGHMLDAFRARTPHVYTLGDWLPRATHDGAIRHLLRRYRVESLVAWNGTVLFYDQVGAWRRAFPYLRISSQIYNHEGGWIRHCGPRVRRHVDTHFAVNTRIGDALVARHGIDPTRVTVIHPAARIVDLPTDETRARRTRERRTELGLPLDALVVGTFIRLHPQKRPLDILHVARRFVDRGVHFLLVGGGPLDAEVDRALAANPLPNLRRLGLRHDVEALYDALDVCFMTSAFEGLPVFLLDGLARAIPCVTTAVGDIPLLLADGGGVAVERPGDLDALAAGIETMRDPEHRAAEGARGRATVAARFDLETFAQRYRAEIFPDPRDAP